LHGLLSAQLVPFATGGFAHTPVPGSQVPALWQRSGAVQVIGAPWQTPLVHTSALVHRLPSLHEVPLASTGVEQAPVPGSQVPAA
jgi:hypothetical protein